MSTIYTIRQYETNNLKKPLKEYIFVGDILDNKTLKGLNNNNLRPDDVPILKKYGVKTITGITQIYITDFLINYYDSWSEVYLKILKGTKIGSGIGQGRQLYLWVEDYPLLTHRFFNRETLETVNLPTTTPWKIKTSGKNWMFGDDYFKLNVINQLEYRLNHTLEKNVKVINFITQDKLNQIFYNTNNFDDILKICFPPILADKYPSTGQSLKRENDLELNRLFFRKEFDFDKKINLGDLKIKQSKILVNHDLAPRIGKIKERFINLETIFNLYTLEDSGPIFMKLRKDDTSIAKFSRDLNRKNEIMIEVTANRAEFLNSEIIKKWSNPNNIPKGLLIKKIIGDHNKKNSKTNEKAGGLVEYLIYDVGLVEINFNFINPIKKENGIAKDIAIEIISDELKYFNRFLKDINKLDYQITGFENNKIALADLDFFSLPPNLTNTRFAPGGLRSQILFQTDRRMINFGHLNMLMACFRQLLIPFGNWEIFAGNKIQLEDFKNIKRAYFHYILTNNNPNPNDLDKLNGPIYYLGLLGDLRIITNVTNTKKINLITKYQNLFGFKTNEITTDDLTQYLNLLKPTSSLYTPDEFKEGGPGVMVSLGIAQEGYTLKIHDASSMFEIETIEELMNSVVNFYFQLKTNRKLKQSIYNCSTVEKNLVTKDSNPEALQIVEELPYADPTDNGIVDLNQGVNLGLLDDLADDDLDVYGWADQEEALDVDQAEREIETKGTDDIVDFDLDIDEPIPKKDLKTPLAYLKEISILFKKRYARYGCPGDSKPVVITLSEYWKNYRKIKMKIKTWYDLLSKADQEKFPHDGQKDDKSDKKALGVSVNSREESLEHIQKQLKFLKNSIQKITFEKAGHQLSDFSDLDNIIERFIKGFQIKIPLDMDYRNYSDFKFFFCPFQWCPACREPKVGSDINKKACQNCYSNVITNPKKSYVWFPNAKEFAHLRCLPCCYVKPPDKKTSDCIYSHPSRKIVKSTDVLQKIGANVDYIMRGETLPEGRFGFLDIDGNMGPLNDKFNNGLEFKSIKNNQPIYVRQGVRKNPISNNAFLEAILLYTTIEQADKLRDYLIKTLSESIFSTLNRGIIFSIFKTETGSLSDALINFKDYLRNEYLNEDFLWDFLSRPGVLKEEGLNLLIIQRSGEGKYQLICPNFLPFQKYYHDDRPIALLFKLSNNLYQPITQISQIPRFDDQPLQTEIVSDNLMSTAKNPPIYFLIQEALKNCIEDRVEFASSITLSQLEDLIGPNRKIDDDNIVKLYLDPYFQITYVFLKSTFRMPIKPIPLTQKIIDKGYELILDGVDDGLKLNYEQTLKMFEKINKLSGSTRSEIKNLIASDNDLLIGIRLQNNLVIPFKPRKLTTTEKKNLLIGRFPIISEVMPYKVDSIINKQNETNELNDRILYVNQVLFQKEAYQRLRYQLGKYLVNDKTGIKKAEDIEKILKSELIPTAEKRKKLENIVNTIVKQIAKLRTLTQNILRTYYLPQIRTLCSNNKDFDPHCTDNGKVILPSIIRLPNNIEIDNSYERNVTLIVDELLRNNVKRNELLKGKVSIYVSTERQVNNPDKEVLLIHDVDKKIDQHFSSERKAIKKYEKHYFLNKSEIYRRGIKIFLYTLDEPWYKFISENFIHNSRNIYTMLDRALNTNIVEELVDTFLNEKIGGWKLWLTQLKNISPADYDTINTKDQFIEKIKYGKPLLTNIHLAILSKAFDVKFIILDKNKVKNFFCLGNTMVFSDKFLIIYRDGEDDYLVGKTEYPDDLSIETSVDYLFEASEIPKKLKEIWLKSCGDTDNQKKSLDKIESLITVKLISPEILDEDTILPDEILDEDLILPDDQSMIKNMVDIEQTNNTDTQKKKPKVNLKKPTPKPKINLKKPTPKKPKINLKKPTPKKPKINLKKPSPKISPKKTKIIPKKNNSPTTKKKPLTPRKKPKIAIKKK